MYWKSRLRVYCLYYMYSAKTTGLHTCYTAVLHLSPHTHTPTISSPSLVDPDKPHADDDQSVAGNDEQVDAEEQEVQNVDRKSTRLNSSHL